MEQVLATRLELLVNISRLRSYSPFEYAFDIPFEWIKHIWLIKGTNRIVGNKGWWSSWKDNGIKTFPVCVSWINFEWLSLIENPMGENSEVAHWLKAFACFRCNSLHGKTSKLLIKIATFNGILFFILIGTCTSLTLFSDWQNIFNADSKCYRIITCMKLYQLNIIGSVGHSLSV